MPTPTPAHAEETLRAAGELRAKLDEDRNGLIEMRDWAAGSLIVHDGWTEDAVRDVIGASSLSTWAKSRKRLVEKRFRPAEDETDPNRIRFGDVPAMPNAEEELRNAVKQIADIDARLPAAREAVLKGILMAKEARPDITITALATAAQVSKQYVSTRLTRERVLALTAAGLSPRKVAKEVFLAPSPDGDLTDAERVKVQEQTADAIKRVEALVGRYA